MIGNWRVLYRLDENRQVVAEDDAAAWAEWMADDDIDGRRVGLDEFPNGYVSTVFLGIDLSVFPHHQPPRCFETMAFRYRGANELPEGIYQTRASTWAEAAAQHAEAVRSYRASYGDAL